MHRLSSSGSKTKLFFYKLAFWALFLGIYSLLGLYGHIHARGVFTKAVTVRVSSGEHLPQITDQLYSLGLIRSKFLFNIYIRFTHKDRSLKKGQYVFEPHSSGAHIADSIFKGFGMYYRVFLPEGFTTLRMINSIKKYNFLKEKKPHFPSYLGSR